MSGSVSGTKTATSSPFDSPVNLVGAGAPASSPFPPLPSAVASFHTFATGVSEIEETSSEAGSGAASAESSPVVKGEPVEKKKQATPDEVRKMKQVLEEAEIEYDLTKTPEGDLVAGLKKLENLSDTPGSKLRAAVALRVQDTILDKLTEGAAAGSVAYHTSGATNLLKAAGWFKRALSSAEKVLRGCKHVPLGAGAPVQLWNMSHIERAEEKGQALVGFHLLMCEAEFGREYVCHRKIISPSNGVVVREFSSTKEKSMKPKTSSFFPPGCFTRREELIAMGSLAPVIAKLENRQLVVLKFGDHMQLYAEMFIREGGKVVYDIFPFFAYFHFEKGRSYQVTDGLTHTQDKTLETKPLTLSSDELLKLAAKAIEITSSDLKAQNRPLRYLVRKEKGQADLVLELAPQLVKTTHVPQGIFVQIPTEAFSEDKALMEKIAAILSRGT